MIVDHNKTDIERYLNVDEGEDFNYALEYFYKSFLGIESEKDSLNSASNKIYRASNENLSAMFYELSERLGGLDGKKVLTVGSSGDQIIFSVLYGAKEITFVDADLFAIPYIEYKLAVIKNFPYIEARKILGVGEINEKPLEAMYDWRVYQKISHDISPKSREFWDNIMLEQHDEREDNKFISEYIYAVTQAIFLNEADKEEILEDVFSEENYLLIRDFLNDDALDYFDNLRERGDLGKNGESLGLTKQEIRETIEKQGASMLMNHEVFRIEDLYNILRRRLLNNECTITYKVADVCKPSTFGDKKYDLILLSNVVDYVPDKSEYAKIIARIYENNLKDGGAIQIDYKWKAGLGKNKNFYNQINQTYYNVALKESYGKYVTVEEATFLYKEKEGKSEPGEN